MQPFTFDQSVIAALLFILGLLIGMFFLAGGKWKGRYRAERARVLELERENERLGSENREFQSLRHAAVKAPVGTAAADPDLEARPVATREPYRRLDPDPDGPADLVIRRP